MERCWGNVALNSSESDYMKEIYLFGMRALRDVVLVIMIIIMIILRSAPRRRVAERKGAHERLCHRAIGVF
jgi:hypothetical protein